LEEEDDDDDDFSAAYCFQRELKSADGAAAAGAGLDAKAEGGGAPKAALGGALGVSSPAMVVADSAVNY
jgi:hypothetical protein